MRRTALICLSLSTTLASACSWHRAGPSPIDQSLAFAQCCIAVQIATTGFAILWVLRHRQSWVVLPLFLVFPLFTKLAMGTGYSGDCGGFAAFVALISAGMALSLFTAMLAMERRKGRKVSTG